MLVFKSVVNAAPLSCLEMQSLDLTNVKKLESTPEDDASSDASATQGSGERLGVLAKAVCGDERSVCADLCCKMKQLEKDV